MPPRSLATFDLEKIWDEATADDRRTIIEDLLGSAYFYPDQLMVQVLEAPPILVTLGGSWAPSRYQNLLCRRGDSKLRSTLCCSG